jgi:hypothetical protein
MSLSHNVRRSGFTLAELIVVVGIVGVLIALIFPSLALIPAKADEIVCMSHLHELWIKFAPCATEPDGWPQLPRGVKPGTPEEGRFWLDYASNSLDVSASTWQCPTIAKAVRRSPPGTLIPLIDYLPTLFDSRPGTPNRWPSMPWFSEIANVHGRGNLTVTADGSVQPSVPLGMGTGSSGGGGGSTTAQSPSSSTHP